MQGKAFPYTTVLNIHGNLNQNGIENVKSIKDLMRHAFYLRIHHVLTHVIQGKFNDR